MEPTPAGRETLSDEHAADIIQLVREKQRAIREAKREALYEFFDELTHDMMSGEAISVGVIAKVYTAQIAALRGGQP